MRDDRYCRAAVGKSATAAGVVSVAKPDRGYWKFFNAGAPFRLESKARRFPHTVEVVLNRIDAGAAGVAFFAQDPERPQILRPDREGGSAVSANGGPTGVFQ